MLKSCWVILLIFFFSSWSVQTWAQKKEEVVHFMHGSFKTSNNISKQKFRKEQLRTAVYGDKYFVLVQFSSIPTKKQQLLLKAAGIELNSYLPGNAYLASIKNKFDFSIANKFNISSIDSIPSNYKIDSSVNSPLPGNDDEHFIAVSYYPSFDRTTAQTELQKSGASIIHTKFDAANVIFVRVDRSKINRIAALPFVSYISLQRLKDKPLNYNDVAAHGISGLNALGGKNLKGEGVTVGVGDNADMSTHIDFAGRLIVRTPWYPDFHGTYTAGTVGGAGIIDVKYHGMAPKVTIINQYFSDIITQASTYISDYNMIATNNSYYSADDGCAGEGTYDALSNYADAQLRIYDQLIHVIAAGNDGDNTCSPYPTSFATIKSGWQCAKNVLSVGALSTYDYTIADFSSRGPTNDGRLKPEITCGGVNVTSTTLNNGYTTNSGTSISAPVITGTLALLYQRYRQLHGTNPKAALMKAMICNTAEDLGNTGPDYTFGFGMLNARRAVEAIDSNWYFIDSVDNGDGINRTITLPSGVRRLKVMLCWTDKEATANAANTLVNDLDLKVTEPSSLVHYPLVLNPFPTHVNNVAVEGADHTNNIEQVDIENPSAGNYTVNVKGFNVPFGPQDYVVAYEITRPSVTVEYPYGGETLVPGETENIRWNGYGNETNTYTIQYSANNGNTWATLSNTAPANSMTYSWTVPPTATDSGLIRVMRNGTSLVGQSHFNFCILGRPLLTIANTCEGAVQLSWNSIASATSYDILQLVGDTMQVIGNTTDTGFQIKGLNKYQSYWFGVSAKNGATAGRRSLSVNVIPTGGACTLSTFDNDIKVDSILQPNTSRKFFADSANATAPVQIRIKNLGSTTITAPFTVSYSCEGGNATETINTSIAANSTYIYTFTTPYTINNSGFHYHFESWATYSADSNHLNDTAFKTVKLLANPKITSFPVLEGFETTDSESYVINTLGIDGDDALDFTTNTIKGRARTFVNTGFARSGNRALTLDQWPADLSNATADSLFVNYNLAAMDTAQLRFDFYYKNQGQSDYPGNKVWIRGSENDQWIQAYDLYANQGGLGEWQHGLFNINDLLKNASPAQNVSATFQMKFGEEGLTSANSPDPDLAIDNGYTFDDLTLQKAENDLALVQIVSPERGGCGLAANSPITIQIKNYSNNILTNVPVSYQLNNGIIITETIPSIAADTILNYTFNHTGDFSAYVDYTLNAWVKYNADNYPVNDSILNYTFHNTPVINSYPYLQGFENDSGSFYTGGINSSWQWGTPNKVIIYKAANGNKAWVTSLNYSYNDDETSYLYSPCFDLSSLSHPMLSFSHIYQLEHTFDYAWVEYSVDGINWQRLGAIGSGTNWYDTTADNQSWNISDTIWHVASISIPTTSSNVHFRFVLNSDQGVTMAGIGIDDIHIFDSASIYTGTPLTSLTQNVSGNTWINFNDSSGKRVVSINPNGVNLGSTNVQVYPKTGTTRAASNYYYLNRDIVIQPSIIPTDSVSIRFYFTDSEANNIIHANSCSSCVTTHDAYELGVAKYSGYSFDENGILDDDTTGLYAFIPKSNFNIIPFSNGYYADFKVKNFSEFWLSKALVKAAGSPSCEADTISYTATGGSTYQWQLNSGSGYTNLSNGTNYSGVSTNTLRIIGLPTSDAGYHYRCVINGIPGNGIALRFGGVWNGSVNTDWFTSGNWSCGIVPDQYTDVTIPESLTNYPVIDNNAAVKSIHLRDGSTIELQPGFNLNITGH